METLAYPHLTLAHTPQSDPPAAIAMADVLNTLPVVMTQWLRAGRSPSRLSSAGWIALLSTAIATSTWVLGTAAIAQTGVPGDSGLGFTEASSTETNLAPPQPAEASDDSEPEFKPLPELEINREPPKSLAQWLNGVSGGFLRGDGNFREDARKPINPEAVPQQAPPQATSFGVPNAGSFTGGRALRYGMRSPQVGQLQTQLRSLGFFQGRSDGNFGNNTLNAVKAFQRSRGLTSDGVVGSNTRAALYEGAGSGGAPMMAQQPRAVPQGIPQPVVNRTPTRTISSPSTGSICDRYYTRIGHQDVSGSRGNGVSSASGCRIPCTGNKNQNVVALQNRLKTLGYFNFHSTGYYGPITRNAVIRYQRSKGLRPDGIAGPLTKRSLGLNF